MSSASEWKDSPPPYFPEVFWERSVWDTFIEPVPYDLRKIPAPSEAELFPEILLSVTWKKNSLLPVRKAMPPPQEDAWLLVITAFISARRMGASTEVFLKNSPPPFRPELFLHTELVDSVTEAPVSDTRQRPPPFSCALFS